MPRRAPSKASSRTVDSTPALATRCVAANARLAAQGLRVLALAARRTGRLGAGRDEDERDLTVYGLLGFQDPLRPEVPGAVADCQRAGIRITMITGDHALTAHAVAEAAGILHDDDLIVTGDELTALSDAERVARIRRAAIFARISPEQKFLIVDGLKNAGAIVAMTGDGVNDAPALHRADIGIAMGRRGTDVARATADLVLLDDNFASIVETVRQGRHILQNIQRAFLYLIAFHIPIVALAIWAPLIGVPLVLLPIHLVWLELIVHPVSAVVFQAEPAAADIMSRPPRNPAAPLLPRAAAMHSALSGGVLTVASFAMYWWHWPSLGEAAGARPGADRAARGISDSHLCGATGAARARGEPDSADARVLGHLVRQRAQSGGDSVCSRGGPDVQDRAPLGSARIYGHRLGSAGSGVAVDTDATVSARDDSAPPRLWQIGCRCGRSTFCRPPSSLGGEGFAWSVQ